MSEWQPIEKAPKTGNYLLLIVRDIYSDNDEGGPKHKPVLSYWSVNYDGERWAGVGTHWTPVYWMPLPPLPVAANV